MAYLIEKTVVISTANFQQAGASPLFPPTPPRRINSPTGSMKEDRRGGEKRGEERKRSKQRRQKKSRNEKKERNKKITKYYRCGFELCEVNLTKGQLLSWWANLPRAALSTQVN